MSKKTNKTHAKKKELAKKLAAGGLSTGSATTSATTGVMELFCLPGGTKPVEEKFATAVQLQGWTGMDDAQLRRLGNPGSVNPATGLPWMPKPVRGQYEVSATILGALAWWRAQADKRAMDHPTYTSMEEAEARGLIPREFQQWAKTKGTDFINANRSIESEPLRKLAADILRKIFSSGAAQIKGIEGLEELDSDLELAKVRREDARERARNNALEEGKIHSRERVEEILWDNGVAPLRAGLLNFRKTVFGKVDLELDKAAVQGATREVVRVILTDALENLLATIREAFPKK